MGGMKQLWGPLVVYPLIRLQFGVQIIDEEDQLKFGFDVLDPTKIIPEELVPVTKLGKLTLNRNPTNYFAETEQVMVSRILSKKINISDFQIVSTRPYRTRYRL
jgi:catalase